METFSANVLANVAAIWLPACWRPRPAEALPLLSESRQRFAALGLAHWVAAVEQTLAEARALSQLL